MELLFHPEGMIKLLRNGLRCIPDYDFFFKSGTLKFMEKARIIPDRAFSCEVKSLCMSYWLIDFLHG